MEKKKNIIYLFMGRDLEIKKKNVILLYIIKFDEKKI
jgi:hypothetical protein